MKQRLFKTIICLGLVAAATGLLVHGPTRAAGGPDLARVRTALDKAMPAWDKQVLAAKAGPDWIGQVNFPRIFQAAGDKAPSWAGGAPPIVHRLAYKNRILRLEPARGLVRYVNR